MNTNTYPDAYTQTFDGFTLPELVVEEAKRVVLDLQAMIRLHEEMNREARSKQGSTW